MDALSGWLRHLGLEHFEPVFAENGVDLDALVGHRYHLARRHVVIRQVRPLHDADRSTTRQAADAKLNQRDGLHPTAAGVDAIVARILPKAEELVARVRDKRGM